MGEERVAAARGVHSVDAFKSAAINHFLKRRSPRRKRHLRDQTAGDVFVVEQIVLVNRNSLGSIEAVLVIDRFKQLKGVEKLKMRKSRLQRNDNSELSWG